MMITVRAGFEPGNDREQTTAGLVGDAGKAELFMHAAIDSHVWT